MPRLLRRLRVFCAKADRNVRRRYWPSGCVSSVCDCIRTRPTGPLAVPEIVEGLCEVVAAGADARRVRFAPAGDRASLHRCVSQPGDRSNRMFDELHHFERRNSSVTAGKHRTAPVSRKVSRLRLAQLTGLRLQSCHSCNKFFCHTFGHKEGWERTGYSKVSPIIEKTLNQNNRGVKSLNS
jgi:hypothetical protein